MKILKEIGKLYYFLMKLQFSEKVNEENGDEQYIKRTVKYPLKKHV